MGKGIDRIYKYDHRIWPYPSPNTTFIIPKCPDTSIHTQLRSAYNASVGSYDVALSGLDQITNHHGNMDVKDNYDSR